MAKNINQVYTANPSTTLPGTALIYGGLSPYGPTDDTAIVFSDLQAQLLANGACLAASTTGIAGTYNNGAAGVGATFTVTATGALILDTAGPFSVGDLVLLKNQGGGTGNPLQNGPYLIQNPGSVGVQPVLIRAPFFNSVNNIYQGAIFHIISGTQADTFWQESNSGPFNVGTTPITFTQMGGGASGITTIDGNTGSATGSTVTMSGDNTFGGYTVRFDATGSTVTLRLTDQDGNIIFGTSAGQLLTPGISVNNVVVGAYSGSQLGFAGTTGGGANTILGGTSANSLINGIGNVFVGFGSAQNYSGSESNNIIVGQSAGVEGENNITRIGFNTANVSQQIGCYIDGISGVTVTGTAVLVGTDGKLGIAVSSERFKDNIQPMDDYSSVIFKLQPILFTYKSHNPNTIQRGLSAEKVFEVAPELVILDDTGLPATVKYQELSVLLLNEMQKMKIEIQELKNSK